MEHEDIPELEVRAQVRRIVASGGFVAAESVRRLLEFTVDKTLSGKSDDIKEFTLGLEVFGRKGSFDPQSDSIVRVQARKLRERLLAYYELEGSREPFRIEYHKRSYVPHFIRSNAADELPRSLAVLPFLNLSAEKESGYLCDGITEELIFLLSRVDRLQVVSRSSCFAMRGCNDDVKTMGRKLNATLIVEGSVRCSGDRVRVTAQLINVEDGYHLWSERWEQGIEGVPEIQDQLAAAIAKSLRPRVTPAPPTAGSPPDAQAYQLFLQGRYFWNQRTEHGFQRAIECYQAAIARDAGFARAWAAMADTHILSAAHQLEPPSESLPKARHAASTALRLDSRLACAHSALGSILMVFDRDFEAAARAYQRALDIDPSYAYVWHSIAMLARLQGRTDDALGAMRQAQRLEPLSPAIANDIGFVYYEARRYDEALKSSRETLDLHPGFYRTYLVMSRAQAALGSFEEAIDTCLAARPLFPGRAFLGRLMATLGYCYGRLGRRADAQDVLSELEDMGRQHYVSRYDIALIQTGMGDIAVGLDSLERAFCEDAFWMIDLPYESLFDQLRGEPRFEALCQAVRKPRPAID